jgi:chaperonin cofactor prefoldin
MSSALYARGTMLQTGVRERAERTEQMIMTLQKQLVEVKQELAALKQEHQTLLSHLSSAGVISTPTVQPTESGSA